MKLPRPVIFLGALAALIFVVVFFSSLLLPRPIDSQLLGNKIGGRGEVDLARRQMTGKA